MQQFDSDVSERVEYSKGTDSAEFLFQAGRKEKQPWMG